MYFLSTIQYTTCCFCLVQLRRSSFLFSHKITLECLYSLVVWFLFRQHMKLNSKLNCWKKNYSKVKLNWIETINKQWTFSQSHWTHSNIAQIYSIYIFRKKILYKQSVDIFIKFLRKQYVIDTCVKYIIKSSYWKWWLLFWKKSSCIVPKILWSEQRLFLTDTFQIVIKYQSKTHVFCYMSFPLSVQLMNKK